MLAKVIAKLNILSKIPITAKVLTVISLSKNSKVSLNLFKTIETASKIGETTTVNI